MNNKTKYTVLDQDGVPLPLTGYFHSKDQDIVYITLGKNPTAIPWKANKLVEMK